MKTILYALSFSLAGLAPVQAEVPTTQVAPMPQLKFHESWNAEERAALADYADLLFNQAADIIYKSMADSIDTTSTIEVMSAKMGIAIFLNSHKELLSQIIESGDASLRTPAYVKGQAQYLVNEETAALMALRLGRYDMVQLFVLHGCNPSHCGKMNFGLGDSLFSMLFADSIKIGGAEKTLEQRLELAAWLLEHGADINAPCLMTMGNLGACFLPLAFGDEATCLMWALDHGLKYQPERYPDDGRKKHPFYMVFFMEKNLFEAVKRLYETGNLPLNDVALGETPLQKLCSSHGENYQERQQTLLYLLEQGADPNLVGTDSDDSDFVTSPLRRLMMTQDENEAHAAHLEKMKSLLLQYGARDFEVELNCDDEDEECEEEEPLMRRVLKAFFD